MSSLLVPLGQTGSSAIIDEDDAELVLAYRWTRRFKHNGSGDQYAFSNDTKGFMHVLILGPDTDHIDGDGLNNRRSNLRTVTPEQQNQNRRAWGKSQYKGVHLTPTGNHWYMQIIVAGHKFKSRHDTEEEAAMAYDTLARELSGKFARYNFPLPGEQRAY